MHDVLKYVAICVCCMRLLSKIWSSRQNREEGSVHCEICETVARISGLASGLLIAV